MSAIKLAMQVLLDIVESLTVFFSILVFAPFTLFRLSARKHFLLVRRLLPLGVLSSFLRARLSQHLGNHQGAALIYDQIIRLFEGGCTPLDPRHKELTEILEILYPELLASYLSLGRFDHASSLVLRAHGYIGCDGIEGYPELCVQSAHIVKAGLAAGRLLEEGGLKNFFQTDNPQAYKQAAGPVRKAEKPPVSKGEGKVLPFVRSKKPS